MDSSGDLFGTTPQYIVHDANRISHREATEAKIDEQIKSHGRDFWYQLALFLTLRDDGASVAGEIDGCITELRRLLDSMENRDVLYSFAVARHLGQRITDDESQLTAAAAETDADAGAGLTPEQNPRVMLRVARNHIRAEARGEGTTQVVVRLCAIAAGSGCGERARAFLPNTPAHQPADRLLFIYGRRPNYSHGTGEMPPSTALAIDGRLACFSVENGLLRSAVRALSFPTGSFELFPCQDERVVLLRFFPVNRDGLSAHESATGHKRHGLCTRTRPGPGSRPRDRESAFRNGIPHFAFRISSGCTRPGGSVSRA